jgi:hypothetical protein
MFFVRFCVPYSDNPGDSKALLPDELYNWAMLLTRLNDPRDNRMFMLTYVINNVLYQYKYMNKSMG